MYGGSTTFHEGILADHSIQQTLYGSLRIVLHAWIVELK